MDPIKINQLEDFLDRKKTIALPVREIKNFLENCADYMKKSLDLPDDAIIIRVYVDETRNSLMFEVCSKSYDLITQGDAPKEIYLSSRS